MRGIGLALLGTPFPAAGRYQLPQPLRQLFQPLRQLFQLFHGSPKLKFPQGRPKPKPKPLPQPLCQARRWSPARSSVCVSGPDTADTASRIAASLSETRSCCPRVGCWPAGSGSAAAGAAEPSNSATPTAPGVTSSDTTFRYFCGNDNGSSLSTDRWFAKPKGLSHWFWRARPNDFGISPRGHETCPSAA